MKFLIFVGFFLFACIQSGLARSKKCKRLELRADKCFKTAFYIGEKVIIAKNAKEYEEYCSKVKNSIICGRDFKTCLTGLPLQVYDLAVKGMVKAYQRNCQDASKVPEILKLLDCIEITTGDLYSCFSNTITHFRYVAANVTSKALIPSSCCAYAATKQCFYDRFTQKCEKNGKETAAFVQSLFDDVLSEAITWVCKKWQTIEECNGSFPDLMKKFEDIVKTSKVDISEAYLINPMLQLAARFTD